MKIIQQTPDRLILKEPNWNVWFQSALFTGFGFFIIVETLHKRELPGFEIMLFVMGLLALFLSEINILDFNANTSQFILKRQRLLGTKYIRHSLSEIVGVEVKSISSAEATHKVVILLSSGKHVPLSSFASGGDYKNKQKTVMLIRNFLHQVSERQS